MRTVKITHDLDTGSGNRMQIETEVIVADDEEAKQAGREAQEFVSEFMEGLGEAAS